MHKVFFQTGWERKLDPKADIPTRFITSEELRQNYTQLLEKYYSKEEARRDVLEMWLLRLIDDPDLDLYQLNIDLAAQSFIGYYHPDEKVMHVVGDADELNAEEKVTLAHEYIHSLQDQHFDLRGLLDTSTDDYDAGLAASALVEGDATYSMVAYAKKYLGSVDMFDLLHASRHISDEALVDAPVYFSDAGTFTYDRGYEFAQALANAEYGDLGKINEALRNPPRSTEQILHPEKYLDNPRDDPLPVAIPPLTGTLATGWTFAHETTIGEFDLTEIIDLNCFDCPVEAEEAGAGWGGGRFALYTSGDDALLLTVTRWDTEEEASQFYRALLDTFGWGAADGDFWHIDDRFFGGKQSGDTVAFVASHELAAAKQALDAVK